VVSDGVALAEEIEQCGAGISVPSGNAVALAEAIAKLSTRIRMDEARSAARTFAQRFLPDVVTVDLLRLYDSVVYRKTS